MKKIKILITSVGSLVGKNIIEALEFPTLPRRHLVYLIGTNSIVDSPNNYSCDKFYTVPNTSNPKFISVIKDIIKNEEPDLILSGRDVDTEVVTKLMKSNPQLKGEVPYGELKSLSYGLNKWKTWLFTQKYKLPFSNTFVLNKSGGLQELKQFIEKYDYPLIAKPIKGFASKGIFFIRNWNQAEEYANKTGYMLQEYLGKQCDLNEYFKLLDSTTPLFAEAPDIYHYTCHTVIDRNGKINKFFITKNNHKNGATVAICRIKNIELENIAIKYAKAYINEGGYGPFGIQFRKDRYGKWKGQEINLRTNGNTYARLLMGQDDIGLIINSLFPDFKFPIYKEIKSSYNNIIAKYLACEIMNSIEIERLRKIGVWKKQQ